MPKVDVRVNILIKFLGIILLVFGLGLIYVAYTSNINPIHKYFTYIVGLIMIIPSIIALIADIEE